MNALTKKLFIKPGTNWLFYNIPQDYLTQLEPLPAGVKIHFEPEGAFDGIQLFAYSNDELEGNMDVIYPLLTDKTIVWICYPKKSSGIASDLTMMGEWDAVTKRSLETVASASINDTWTGIRLKPKGLAKKTNVANAEIKQNDYSAYIDVDNKLVTLPPDVEAALKTEPEAYKLYNSLAYSHRKEYVL
jgi:hypothetical protein